MKFLFKFSPFILAAFLLSSCNPLSPFTQRIYDQYDWSEEDLKKVQFYVSDNIVLKRQVRDGDAKINSGKIRLVDGKKIEEVIVEKGTPGVLIYLPKGDRFAVSFDEDDKKYLMFGPNSKQGGKYVLLANEWKKNYGSVSYDGKVYRTDSESAYATLMVDLRAAKKVSIKREKATGRKID